MEYHLEFVSLVAISPSNKVSQNWICLDNSVCCCTDLYKLLTKLAVSASYSILTSGQPVSALTSKGQASRGVTTRQPLSETTGMTGLKLEPKFSTLWWTPSPLRWHFGKSCAGQNKNNTVHRLELQTCARRDLVEELLCPLETSTLYYGNWYIRHGNCSQ